VDVEVVPTNKVPDAKLPPPFKDELAFCITLGTSESFQVTFTTGTFEPKALANSKNVLSTDAVVVVSVVVVVTAIVELSASLIVVVPVLLVLLTELVKVFNVDCTLPLPSNSNVVLEFVVKGDPEELVIVLPLVSRIIFL
jgi:hypothetical protein